MKLRPLLINLSLCLLTCSCGHVFTKNHTYEEKNAKGAVVNGATIFAELEPQGGKGGLSASAMVYFAGSATLEGPFRWSINARGKTGEHEVLRVNAIKTTTKLTNRSEWFPQAYLGEDATFKKTRKDRSAALAKVKLPGLLEVYPEKDGPIDLLVDVTVESTSGKERKMVKFSLSPVTKRKTEFIFLPSEIVQSFSSDKFAEE